MFATYIRVSTQRQGVSGLGMDGQRAALASAGIVGREFVEIMSGRKRDRPILHDAVEYCKQTGATLVVAKLDRLARDVQFMFSIANAGINIRALDVPDLNTLTIGIFATMAQYEAERISQRTKTALDAKRRRGDAEWRVSRLTNDDRQRGAQGRRNKARDNKNNKRAAAFIAEMMSGGRRVSFHRMAAKLNDAGFTTSTGRQFTAVQVRRLAMSNGLVAAA